MLKQMVKAILPEALKPVAREVRAFFKGQDLLKYPYPRNLIIDNSEKSSANRAYVREILHTKYNENYDKIMHDYFINNKNNAIHKWYMYFDAYERTFSRFRGKNVNILEIGVQNGGSARMWRDYFTHDLPNARVKIFGIDINPKCKDFADENIEIFIGDAENRSFWRDLKGKIPKIDILIDDGGHTMRQQIVAFEEMFPHIADNGVYFIEDLHTSYWRQMGGGHKNKKSFIEYSKNLIDQLNAYHATTRDKLHIDSFTNHIFCMSFYDSIVAIEKRVRDKRQVGCAVIGENRLGLEF